MFNFAKQLLEVAPWVSTSFPIIRIVLMAVIVLCAIAIIIAVLRMESNPEGGSNVITGSSDSFYAQNQSSTKEGRLKKLIIICGIILIVCALVFFVTLRIYSGN